MVIRLRLNTKEIMKSLFLIGFFLIVFVKDTTATTKLTFSTILNSPLHKIAEQTLKEAYKQLDIQVRFVAPTSKRSLEEMNKGKIDGEVVRIHRTGTIYPTLKKIPYAVIYGEPTVFSKSRDIVVKGWSSLKEYQVGILNGASYTKKGIDHLRYIHQFHSSKHLMQALNNGQVDLVVILRFDSLFRIKKMRLKSIYTLSSPFQRVKGYHYLHEKHKKLIYQVNAVLKNMDANGEFEEFRNKFEEKYLGRKN